MAMLYSAAFAHIEWPRAWAACGMKFAEAEGTMDKPNDTFAFFAGLVAGAIFGGFVAALLVPRSGPETREQVAERSLELKNRAEDVVQRAQQVASDTVAKVQTAAQDIIRHAPGTEGETA